MLITVITIKSLNGQMSVMSELPPSGHVAQLMNHGYTLQLFLETEEGPMWGLVSEHSSVTVRQVEIVRDEE